MRVCVSVGGSVFYVSVRNDKRVIKGTFVGDRATVNVGRVQARVVVNNSFASAECVAIGVAIRPGALVAVVVLPALQTSKPSLSALQS